MYLPKTFRIFLSWAGAGVAPIVILTLLKERMGRWVLIPALLSFPLGFFLAEGLINKFDFWLRRVTRDPFWVRDQERAKRRR